MGSWIYIITRRCKSTCEWRNRAESWCHQLTNGLVKLDDGAKELSTKLGEGAEKIADVRNDDARNTMFSEPVQLVKSTVSDVPNYGSGIAPYFIACILCWRNYGIKYFTAWP